MSNSRATPSPLVSRSDKQIEVGEGRGGGDTRSSGSPHTPTLTSAIVEVEKTIRDRERYWQDQIERGRARMKPETHERKQADLRHAQTLLVWLSGFRDEIRDFATRLRALPPLAPNATPAQRWDEAEELRKLSGHPAARAVLDEFPGAEIADVRDLPPIPPPAPSAADEEDQAA